MSERKEPARRKQKPRRAASTPRKRKTKARPPRKPRINWTGKAADQVRDDLKPQFERELQLSFPAAETITVQDSFRGYSDNQEEKIVLGVEVLCEDAFNTHVVKLGAAKEVSRDYRGWRKCVLKHRFASRIFVSVQRVDLPDGRMAIVYQDAYMFFGPDKHTQSPQTLDVVTEWAIMDDKPNPVSVERVIRQIYCDLYHWFYRNPQPDVEKALAFYRARLKKANPKWGSEKRCLELRRDAIWLLCGTDLPTPEKPPVYLDPYDCVCWAMHNKRLPQTLVGRSHGDLHGKNILVGVQRGEVEFPAVYDYGDMGDANVLVWDFVKLETEFKVRLLLPLYEDAPARRAVLALKKTGCWSAEPAPVDRPSAEFDPRWLRAERLAFAAEFEWLLAELTERIYRLTDAESLEPPGGRLITGNTKVDRAIAIIMRIRQEAASCLGGRQPQRGEHKLWKDEYYFGLAAYGLATAKFDYREYETEFALVSAGLAAARVESVRAEILEQMSTGPPSGPRPPCASPSYHVPLARAHRLWQDRRSPESLKRALALLEPAAKQFAHAVPLLQEYALLLAEARRHDDALTLLRPLKDACRIFGDEETLARIGRTCKDMGDMALEDRPVPLSKLAAHPAVQWYQTAYDRYREAFDIRGHYYPGINAATLALLCHKTEEAQKLASQVRGVCRRQKLGDLPAGERFWLLATEGEASLLLGESDVAATCYDHASNVAATCYDRALDALPDEQAGMAQSAYNQVCRLCWALGCAAVEPVVEVFRNSRFDLEPGPLGDCNPSGDLVDTPPPHPPQTRDANG